MSSSRTSRVVTLVSPILAIHIRESVHIVACDLAMPIYVAHFGAAVDTEVVMLHIKGAAIVVINGATVGIAVRDDEIVVKVIGCRYV